MPSEFISVKRVVFVSTLTGLCWLALTDNRGWWFFFALWLAILYWQYVNQLNLPPIRWHRLPGFLMFFSKQLVLGAFDVAWRALAIKPNIAPQWQWYPVRLSQPASRQLLASLISLLPGTCSAQVQHHRQRT
ncbi:Na+/H+ antiporter subunit E, partial [Arsukibacterium sp.]|uniref:Na+/H+ antiporter subunit E n=1 Tax=Arsukibacterium sp. TaxID=1977258 RepID=UPI00299DD80C